MPEKVFLELLCIRYCLLKSPPCDRPFNIPQEISSEGHFNVTKFLLFVGHLFYFEKKIINFFHTLQTLQLYFATIQQLSSTKQNKTFFSRPKFLKLFTTCHHGHLFNYPRHRNTNPSPTPTPGSRAKLR